MNKLRWWNLAWSAVYFGPRPRTLWPPPLWDSGIAPGTRDGSVADARNAGVPTRRPARHYSSLIVAQLAAAVLALSLIESSASGQICYQFSDAQPGQPATYVATVSIASVPPSLMGPPQSAAGPAYAANFTSYSPASAIANYSPQNVVTITSGQTTLTYNVFSISIYNSAGNYTQSLSISGMEQPLTGLPSTFNINLSPGTGVPAANFFPNGLTATLPPASAWAEPHEPFGGVSAKGFPGTDFSVYTIGSACASTSSVPTPTIAPSSGVVSGASFQPGIAPNAWFTINGTNLSSTTDTWASAIVNGNLPTSLDSVSVSVGGAPAYIYYVSPTQINAVAPNVGPGNAAVTVTNSYGTSSAVTAVAQAVQPAFFQWGTYAVATRQDYSLAVKNGTFAGTTTVPAKPGDVIIFWGTGLGPTNPPAPVGAEVPSSSTYNTASPVTVAVGTTPAIVYGAALAPGFAGLYQVAIQIPTSLADGDYPIVATVSGAHSPSTTMITVQK
jgi:uncharacterized protein (TIGR03437 family)